MREISSDEVGLVMAVMADPFCVTTRGVLADLLEEQGNTDERLIALRDPSNKEVSATWNPMTREVVVHSPEYRFQVDYDDDADFSHLEQWDTPAKYKGNEIIDPVCVHCGRATKTVFTEYAQVSIEGVKGKTRFYYVHEESDQKGCFDNLRHIGRPTDGVQFGTKKAKPRKIPFDEYMETYGDPASYSSLQATLYRKCYCCDDWEVMDSMGGISYLSNDCPRTGFYDLDDVVEKTHDDVHVRFLKEIMRDMLSSR